MASIQRIQFTDGSSGDYNMESIGSGTQGEIYAAVDRRSVVKLYKSSGDPAKDRERIERIDKLIGQFNPTKDDPIWREYYTWPEARTKGTYAGASIGFRMRMANGQRIDKYLEIFPKSFARLKSNERGWFIGRIAVAIKLMAAADRMAKSGLCYADFSHRNIFVEPYTGLMTLIDCDSITVPGKLPPEIEGTSWYRAPEIVSGRAPVPTVETDRHSLAVLLYIWLLGWHPLWGDRPPLGKTAEEDDLLRYGAQALYCEDPRDTSNASKDQRYKSRLLGDELHTLFNKAFVDGLHSPRNRPLPHDWLGALNHTYDRLIPCLAQDSCDWRFFVATPSHGLKCPRCGTSMDRPQTLPKVFLLRRNPLGGVDDFNLNRATDHFVVGWPERGLYNWHAQSAASPNYVSQMNAPDRNPHAVFKYDGRTDRWSLQNKLLRGARYGDRGTPSASWKSWAIGETIPLADNLAIQMGDSVESYRALVALVRVD